MVFIDVDEMKKASIMPKEKVRETENVSGEVERTLSVEES
jgi:hypothetical protein